MALQLFATLSATLVAFSAFAESPPPSVSPDVWLVRALGSHRIVIQRLCNPAHCTSRAFLERISETTPPSVQGSVAISELDKHAMWAFVEEVTAHYKGSDTPYYFELHAVDTHGTEGALTLRITPGAELSYTANVVMLRGPE